MSDRTDLINLTLTKEEYDAIPILVSMSQIYLWELNKKTPEDKFWEQHKENMNLIKEYHKKGYQGIMANADAILEKINNKEKAKVKSKIKYEEMNKKYLEYIKTLNKEEKTIFMKYVYNEVLNKLLEAQNKLDSII